MMQEDLDVKGRLHDEFEGLVGPFLREARKEAGQRLIIAGGSQPDLDDVPRRKSPMPG